jgi:hypothetical protein
VTASAPPWTSDAAFDRSAFELVLLDRLRMRRVGWLR